MNAFNVALPLKAFQYNQQAIIAQESSRCLLEELKSICGMSQNTLSAITYIVMKWVYHKLSESYEREVSAKKDELKKQFEVSKFQVKQMY